MTESGHAASFGIDIIIVASAGGVELAVGAAAVERHDGVCAEAGVIPQRTGWCTARAPNPERSECFLCRSYERRYSFGCAQQRLSEDLVTDMAIQSGVSRSDVSVTPVLLHQAGINKLGRAVDAYQGLDRLDRGVIGVCIGSGQGVALVLENPHATTA